MAEEDEQLPGVGSEEIGGEAGGDTMTQTGKTDPCSKPSIVDTFNKDTGYVNGLSHDDSNNDDTVPTQMDDERGPSMDTDTKDDSAHGDIDERQGDPKQMEVDSSQTEGECSKEAAKSGNGGTMTTETGGNENGNAEEMEVEAGDKPDDTRKDVEDIADGGTASQDKSSVVPPSAKSGNGGTTTTGTGGNENGNVEEMDVEAVDKPDDTQKDVEDIAKEGTASQDESSVVPPSDNSSATNADDGEPSDETHGTQDTTEKDSTSQVDGASNLESETPEGNDGDVQIISNVKKPEDDVIVIDDDDDDDEPVKPQTKPVRKKSSQAPLCKCILCGDMVRLSTLGVHVNSTHSKLIVKGNSNIECKVCLESYGWNDFVDHAQTKHKWSIVKNSSSKVTPATNSSSTKAAPPQGQLRKDYKNMGIRCLWCKENTDVSLISSHFKQVHKVDEKVIERALYLNHSKTADQGAPIPTGIMGALFVMCQECNKEMKFSDIISHFQSVHKDSKRTPQRSVQDKPTNGMAVRAVAPSTTVKQPAPVGRIAPVAPFPQARPPLNKNEQLITLFKGQVNPSKSPNYALVKLAHDGKDKILSIPFGHPIAQHRVHTIAVKGKLDDIPALIQSVTDMLAAQQAPPPIEISSNVQRKEVPQPSIVEASKKPADSEDKTTSNTPSAEKSSESTTASGDNDIEEIPSTDKEESKSVGGGNESRKVETSEATKDGSLNKDGSSDKDGSLEKEEKDGKTASLPNKDEEEASDSADKDKKDEETSPSKQKKGSPRGSLNRLLELQKESLATTVPEEDDAESSGTPLRRSSRRAKMAAKLKIKSVVEKEVHDWKKQLDQPEYIPGDDEEEEGNKKSLSKQNVFFATNTLPSSVFVSPLATKTIEQFIFKVGGGGRKVLVPVPSTTNAQRTVPQVRMVVPDNANLGTVPKAPSSASTTAQNKTLTSPVVQKKQITTPQMSPIAPKKKMPTILQPRSPVVSIQASPLRGSVITSPQTTTILPGGITIQTPQVYQQSTVQTSGQVVLSSPMSNSGYIIQQQQPSLTIVQPSTILQQNVGNVVQLQPQTVPMQSPNMMMMQQNQLQLVTTPQGQQILVMPSNNNVVIPQTNSVVLPQNSNVVISQNTIDQPVVVNQMQQIIGQVGPRSVSSFVTRPVGQQTTNRQATVSQTISGNTSRYNTRSAAAAAATPPPTATMMPVKAAPTVMGQTVQPARTESSDPVIIKRGNNQLVRIADLQKVKEGYVCHQSDISVVTTKETVMKEVQLVKKADTPVPVTKADNIGFQAKKASDDFLRKHDEFVKMVLMNVLTKTITPSDFPDIPSVMFECSRCGTGLPTYMLLTTHLAECFDNPPVEEKAYIIRLPFPLLQMYFETGTEPGGVVSCKLCSKIISRSNNKDLGPLQAHVREHQAQNTAQKGGSVTFGVLSLTKVCILKCKICGEDVLRLWQDITPMSLHLQKHIKGNVEILCNQPPVYALTSKAHAQHISKKAYTWVDYIVPPFTMENPPISEKQKNLDHHVATHGILHYESLLPRRKRRHMMLPEAPKLRGKGNQAYQSNLKPLIIETNTADTMTSYDIKPGKTNLLHSIKIMPSPNKMKRSTLTASIPIKAKHKTFMAQSSGSTRRKIFRQGQYRSARLQEKREKYLKEMDEAAAAGTNSPLNPSTPVKEQEMSKNDIHPVTCSKLHSAEKSPSEKTTPSKPVPSATMMLKRLANTTTPKKSNPKDTSNLRDQSTKAVENPPVKKVHIPNPELTIPDDSDDEVTEVPITESSWAEKGTEYVEPVMPPRTPSPEKPETPPPPITEVDIQDYLHILEGCDKTLEEKNNVVRPLPEIGDVSLSDYFGDSANTSILCEPLIIEQGQAPMYFTRSASTGYRFKCSFSKCEAAVPNNTLVMLAHLSQHFRVRIAGDFSQNGSVVGHRRTCKSLPLTINQVGAHFTLSDKEEASLHAGEVQMAYVCQWRNCNRTRTFKKGLITHLYRHVTFHLITTAQHNQLKEKSKPLKLSSAQFVPHGSGTKLITESMNASHGLKFDQKKDPKLLGLLNKNNQTSEGNVPTGNYGDGSPLGSLIDRLSKQLMSEKSMLQGDTGSEETPESASESTHVSDGRTKVPEKPTTGPESTGEETATPAGKGSTPTEGKTPSEGVSDCSVGSINKDTSSEGKRKLETEPPGSDGEGNGKGPALKKTKVSDGESEQKEATEVNDTGDAEGDDSSAPPEKRRKLSENAEEGDGVGEEGNERDKMNEKKSELETEKGKEEQVTGERTESEEKSKKGEDRVRRERDSCNESDSLTAREGDAHNDSTDSLPPPLFPEPLNDASLPPPLFPEPLNDASLEAKQTESDESMPDLELSGSRKDKTADSEAITTNSPELPTLDLAGGAVS